MTMKYNNIKYDNIRFKNPIKDNRIEKCLNIITARLDHFIPSNGNSSS